MAKKKAKTVVKKKVSTKAKTTAKKKTSPKTNPAAAKAKADAAAKTKADAAAKAKADAAKKKAEVAQQKTSDEAKEQTSQEAPVSSSGAIKILSVDDEEVIRTLINKVLTKAGYDVKLAESGEDGLKVMKNETFDLAIIDLKMPGMGGLAFLGEMKEIYPDTEAIILTGFGDIDNAVDAMKKGAFNFVPKPFKKDTFLTIVEKALERKIMKKELDEAKNAMRNYENEAAKKIGVLQGQLAAVEQAKKELGEQFNSIKQALVDGTGEQGELEKKVMSLEKVAGQIKTMEEKLVAAEQDKQDALEKAKSMDDDLSKKVSGKVELGNKIDEAKDNLESIKNKITEETSEEEAATEEISLTDIHQALADFRNEIDVI